MAGSLGDRPRPRRPRTALRDAWRTYIPYRGDTENHWLLYYTCLYLMAQLYPNQPGESWYTGKSSKENFDEARDYLYSWIDLTVTKGQGEYDCTHYEGKPVGVELPATVMLAITEADAVVKGQTASSSYKPAILENGVRVMVPPHVGAGTRIVVNVADATYIERAKD